MFFAYIDLLAQLRRFQGMFFFSLPNLPPAGAFPGHFRLGFQFGTTSARSHAGAVVVGETWREWSDMGPLPYTQWIFSGSWKG